MVVNGKIEQEALYDLRDIRQRELLENLGLYAKECSQTLQLPLIRESYGPSLVVLVICLRVGGCWFLEAYRDTK